MTATLTLPRPLSANRYWRSYSSKGRIVVCVSAEGKSFRNAVVACVLKARDKETKLLPRVPGHVAIAIKLYPRPGGGHQIDIDNAVKVTLDALAYAQVIDNDRNVEALAIRRMTEYRDCMEILIEPYTPEG